ncbi:MAG: DNA gyrase subunit A, partial [Oscillospiraceae bacterium]|nr:DNA gyrase subunit A [Oscillospiraceae bacterium]
RAEIEEFNKDRLRIIVTELSYQVNKSLLLKNIKEQVQEKRLEGISDLRDESDRNGMRIVIELKRDANPQVVLNRLYAQTQLQSNFSIIMLALVNDQSQPKVLTLKEMLEEYIAFQEELILRRTRFDLRKAQERAHLLEGLLIAQDNIDEVIHIIRTSYDDAREKLMARFGLDEVQAQAILDMRLKQLQGLDREKLEAEYKELEERIDYFRRLLDSSEMLRGVLKDELLAIRGKYGDERRTEIQDVEDEIDIEDLIDEELCVFTISRAGYVKRIPAEAYRVQRRGGKGVTGMTTKEEDSVDAIFTASTHDFLLLFTSRGRVYKRKGYMIPEAGRTAKGTNIANIIPTEPGETLSAGLHMAELPPDRFLTFVTRKGTVKRMRFEELKNLKNIGIRALTLEEDDSLIAVLNTSGDDNILIATHGGMAICFRETDVRSMGRTAAGVRGIALREGDWCVGAVSCAEEDMLLTVTENGCGKKTPVSWLRRAAGPQNRGGLGLKLIPVTEKTGPVAGVVLVNPGDHLLLMSSDGVVIRLNADDVNIYGRAAQGVRVMRMPEGAKVISLTVAAPEQEEEAAAETGE